jgi:hypothetical protein
MLGGIGRGFVQGQASSLYNRSDCVENSSRLRWLPNDLALRPLGLDLVSIDLSGVKDKRNAAPGKLPGNGPNGFAPEPNVQDSGCDGFFISQSEPVFQRPAVTTNFRDGRDSDSRSSEMMKSSSTTSTRAPFNGAVTSCLGACVIFFALR